MNRRCLTIDLLDVSENVPVDASKLHGSFKWTSAQGKWTDVLFNVYAEMFSMVPAECADLFLISSSTSLLSYFMLWMECARVSTDSFSSDGIKYLRVSTAAPRVRIRHANAPYHHTYGHRLRRILVLYLWRRHRAAAAICLRRDLP